MLRWLPHEGSSNQSREHVHGWLHRGRHSWPHEEEGAVTLRRTKAGRKPDSTQFYFVKRNQNAYHEAAPPGSRWWGYCRHSCLKTVKLSSRSRGAAWRKKRQSQALGRAKVQLNVPWRSRRKERVFRGCQAHSGFHLKNILKSKRTSAGCDYYKDKRKLKGHLTEGYTG